MTRIPYGIRVNEAGFREAGFRPVHVQPGPPQPLPFFALGAAIGLVSAMMALL
ncbi:hypothetical protein [Gemmobacter serpentinus]|uniref:hypothetical protein n=1 Tax=Gemmobacter serpentinus TaxID=2652247 RepID=UPI001865767F|nr:hypothetical protein [Gemmobacter serpentinus]